MQKIHDTDGNSKKVMIFFSIIAVTSFNRFIKSKQLKLKDPYNIIIDNTLYEIHILTILFDTTIKDHLFLLTYTH